MSFGSHYPGEFSSKIIAANVLWRMIPYDEPRDMEVIPDGERFLLNSKSFDLTLADLTLQDSGRYRCLHAGEIVRIYDILVVETDKTITVSVEVVKLFH